MPHDTLADFYAAHGLAIHVGSDPEGAYGAYAHALARYLPKYMPGHPKVDVSFMPGAGGLRLANATMTILPRDGSAIAAIRGANPIEPLLNPGGEAAFDPRELNWIGSVSRQNGTVVTWHTSPIKTIADARSRDVIVGAGTPDSNIGTLPNILNAVLGTRFRTKHGYSSRELHHALESGEVEGICGAGFSTLIAAHGDWIKENKLNILAHTGLGPDPMMPGVPCTLAFATSKENEMVIRLMDYRQVLGRPYVAPPDTPADRLAALRAAFDAVMQDQTFIKEAVASGLIVDPVDHADILTILNSAYAMPPAVVRRTWDLLNGRDA